MPHLTLEYTSNVSLDPGLSSLFQKLHNVLASTGGIKLENCKSRAYAAEDFLVGSGARGSGFVHLDIRFLDGRSPGIKQAIGEETRGVLTEWLQSSMQALDLQTTVEVRDIDRSFYFKFPEGTLAKA